MHDTQIEGQVDKIAAPLWVIAVCLIGILLCLLWGDADAATIHVWWYATGDDYWEGTATMYDIRYMDSLMTEESFYSYRARRLKNVPVPDTSGTYQEVFITGLEQGQEYWIGLQSYDEVWGPSGITIFHKVAKPINSPRIGGWRR